jgi:hypothetical protein
MPTSVMSLARIYHLRDEPGFVCEFDNPSLELVIVTDYREAPWADFETSADDVALVEE